MSVHPIHHVTAIAGPAARNLAFYAGVLGLRLIKRTVNFDDPGTYHLYYGDDVGRPGSVLTFFPWERATPGSPGIGEAAETTFRIPEAAFGFWSHRLLAAGVATDPIETRFGGKAIPFADPDGMRLALVATPGAEIEHGWATADVPAEHAIRGFGGVRLVLADAAPTAAILTDVFGFAEIGREDGVVRLSTGNPGPGGFVDIRTVSGLGRPRLGTGSVHHVAFRAADDAEQVALRAKLAESHGIETTDQRDRQYFRSLYFREPGGVLFEIATDVPGFAIDEAPGALGTSLKLPPQYESRRREIEAVLPPLGV